MSSKMNELVEYVMSSWTVCRA